MHPYTEKLIEDYREAYENGSESFKLPSDLSPETIARSRVDAIQAKNAYLKDMEDQDDYLDRVLKVTAYCYIACVAVILASLIMTTFGFDRMIIFGGMAVGLAIAIFGDCYARNKTKHINSLVKYYVAMDVIIKEINERS